MQGIPLATEDSPRFFLELLYRLKIRDAMTRDLVTASRRDSLRHVQQQMKENGITGVPITEGNRLVGIVSVDDIIRALDEGYIDEPVEGRMSRNLIVLEDDMPLSFGISYMEKYRFGRFPVLNREKALVGIITSRDVIVALLLELNREVEKLEREVQPQQDADTDGAIRKEFATRRFDFENAGKPSSEVKALLKERGVDPKTIRRVAIATYELEMNQVVHSYGGRLIVRIDESAARIEATDTGPGIENVDQALTEGFSTATEWVRSLGFGAGMGLPNTKRVADEFAIQSGPQGTSVRVVVHLRADAPDDDAARPNAGREPQRRSEPGRADGSRSRNAEEQEQ